MYAAKVVCALAIVAGMSLLLALLAPLSVQLAGGWAPALAATGPRDIAPFLLLLGRVFVAAWLLIAMQLWVALRHASFVPALAVGIGGTFFAVVATSAKIGMLLPWQLPVNQLASDPQRAQLTLLLGALGGVMVFALMLWRMVRCENPH